MDVWSWGVKMAKKAVSYLNTPVSGINPWFLRPPVLYLISITGAHPIVYHFLYLGLSNWRWPWCYCRFCCVLRDQNCCGTNLPHVTGGQVAPKVYLCKWKVPTLIPLKSCEPKTTLFLSDAIALRRSSPFSCASWITCIETGYASFASLSRALTSHNCFSAPLGISSKISWRLSPSAPVLSTLAMCSNLTPYSPCSQLYHLTCYAYVLSAQFVEPVVEVVRSH